MIFNGGTLGCVGLMAVGLLAACMGVGLVFYCLGLVPTPAKIFPPKRVLLTRWGNMPK